MLFKKCVRKDYIFMTNLNVKCARHCAFCKWWFDPAWSAIIPHKPTMGLWTVIDEKTRRMCLKRDTERAPLEYCSDFKCKVDW